MRIGVNIPPDLYQRMKHIRQTVNVSQVCREAIEAYVDDYERAHARLEADGVDEVAERLCGGEDDLSVDWEELGWMDARDWVNRVDRDSFEHLFHRIDVLTRQGRPIWIVPPPTSRMWIPLKKGQQSTSSNSRGRSKNGGNPTPISIHEQTRSGNTVVLG